MSYPKLGISDIKCNRCNAGYMSKFSIVYKCEVCGQWYDPHEKKYSEEFKGGDSKNRIG